MAEFAIDSNIYIVLHLPGGNSSRMVLPSNGSAAEWFCHRMVLPQNGSVAEWFWRRMTKILLIQPIRQELKQNWYNPAIKEEKRL